jgi:hypothetical protein
MRMDRLSFGALVAVAVLAFFVLRSCAKPPPPPLPQGVQNLSGILQPSDISLKRRGTHVLLQNGVPVYDVESSTVNLREIEGRPVVLQGTYAYNTDADALPVFVVQKVIRGATEQLRAWSVPAFGITIQLPRSWTGVIKPGSAVFTLSGSALPALRIGKETSAVLPFDFLTFTSGSSSIRLEPLVLDSHRAVAVLGEDPNSWNVHVDLGLVAPGRKEKNVLTFAFALDPTYSQEEQLQSLHHMVQTLSFSVSSAASVVPSGTGANANGIPCGGTAGILCPAGFYCAIADVQTDSGRCRHM